MEYHENAWAFGATISSNPYFSNTSACRIHIQSCVSDRNCDLATLRQRCLFSTQLTQYCGLSVFWESCRSSIPNKYHRGPCYSTLFDI